MFTTKYKPTSTKEFIGNDDLIHPFARWLLTWDETNKKNKCLLISGLCGIGKSLLVELVLDTYDFNLVNLSLDDEISKDYIETTIKPIIHSKKTINDQYNALVVSDIDSSSDYGFMSYLTDIIKETQIPVICICNNRYDQSIKSILNYCVDFKMTKPKYQDVYRLIYKIVMAEKIKIREPEIRGLYEQSNGDIRFMLNSLQFGLFKSSKNVQSANIFETTGKLLSATETIDDKYNIYWLANDIHPLMIQENYINNIMGKSVVNQMQNAAYSADSLSDVDLFETQVNMTNWEFEPHVAINVIKTASKCHKNTMIKFPQYLGKISTINKNKREKLLKPQQTEVKETKKTSISKEKTDSPKKRGRPKKEK